MRALDTHSLDLDFQFTGSWQDIPPSLKAWFDCPRVENFPVIFGHWAQLADHHNPQIFCLDHGFTYGGYACIMILPSNKLRRIHYSEIYSY